MTEDELRLAAAELLDLRARAADSVTEAADAITEACHTMAERFHAGGKLLTFGIGACATDAAHIAVEFLHPVITGKRALPALALADTAVTATATGATAVAAGSTPAKTSPGAAVTPEGTEGIFTAQLRCLAEPGDIALGICPDAACPEVAAALAEARACGLATVALIGGADAGPATPDLADHVLVARSDDAAVVKEIHVTMYHVLWELVHVFLEQPRLFAPAVA